MGDVVRHNVHGRCVECGCAVVCAAFETPVCITCRDARPPLVEPRRLGWVLVDMLMRVLLVALLMGAVILGALLIAGNARAAEPCAKAHGVQGGELAPCTGVLLPEKVARDGVKCIKAGLPACQSDLRLEAGKRQADAAKCASDVESCRKRADTCCAAALRRTFPPAPRPWYESDAFRVTVAVVVTGLVVGGGVALLYETGALR